MGGEAVSWPVTHPPSWPGSTRPSIRRAPARRRGILAPADAVVMGRRLKAADDKFVRIFNDIKIFRQTIFPYQNSFLYWADDRGPAHTPHLSRHLGGACARAETAAGGTGTRKFGKTGEQFCCRPVRRSSKSEAGSSEPRQPQGRRREAEEPQRDASRPAFLRIPGEAQKASHAHCRCTQASREDPGARQGAQRRNARARAALATGVPGCEGRAR
jgi:hypothetical protein